MKQTLPSWAQDWFDVLLPGAQALLIMLAAIVLHRLMRRLIARLVQRHGLPDMIAVLVRRILGFLLAGSALLLILDTVGVSGTVLWTAFTGFATVGAVAFFAAWSVLSNIFCAFLIFSTRPFRINDLVELLENGEKPGIKGRVLDINLIYTTLQESGSKQAGTLLQIPNSLFFQRAVRRWQGPLPALPDWPSNTLPPPQASATAPPAAGPTGA